MSSSLNDRSNLNKFTLKKRSHFIPKGLSPIIKDIKPVDTSLPLSAKCRLQDAIIKVYDNDLEIIKNTADFKDLEEFLDKYYEESSKRFGNAPITAYNKYVTHETYAFTKNLFSELEIIGQLDLKFIAGISSSGIIFLFDQHAVHERTRLEKLLKDYTSVSSDSTKYKSTRCHQQFSLELASDDISIVANYKHVFENLGLHFDIMENHLSVRQVPLCFYNKSQKLMTNNYEDTLPILVKNLIVEEVALLRKTRGTVSRIPMSIRDVINNEACRGAVKFGEKLSVGECAGFIKQLSLCQLPFHCAHGRPTVVPLVKLGKIGGNSMKPNLKKLLF